MFKASDMTPKSRGSGKLARAITHGVVSLAGLSQWIETVGMSTFQIAPSTVRPLARDPRVLIGWPLPLGFGLDGFLLLERRGRVYV